MAAGLSRRFGEEDKLLAPWRGKPLVSYAAKVLRSLPLDGLAAVVRSDAVARELGEIDHIHQPAPERGQGTSLAIGAAYAAEQQADRLLILLADMPLVSARHAEEVLKTCTDDRPCLSRDGELVAPPACFPGSWFAELKALEGDQGAGSLLRRKETAPLFVDALRGELRDVDTVQDLEEAAA
nr:nucleotidyltransferase family protein [Parvularcula maris]